MSCTPSGLSIPDALTILGTVLAAGAWCVGAFALAKRRGLLPWLSLSGFAVKLREAVGRPAIAFGARPDQLPS